MLFFMVIYILTTVTYTASGNAGSTLFYNRRSRMECWNEDDIAKLRARKTFEEMIPSHIDPVKVNAKYIKDTIRYFRRALRFVDKEIDNHTAWILKEALADTIGAHLRSEILPTVRFAYYAGYVPYRYARHTEDLFSDIKTYLNTQGLGWTPPKRVPQWSNLTVAKILIGAGRLFDPCTCLVTKRDSNSCIHLPIPKLDDEQTPSVLVLPFKTGGLASLLTADSENILLKYYTAASRCILKSSPESCRHSDFVNFNNEMWHWMKREVAPHLVDEKLYAAYGGVLRIAAAVQNYGKGLSRRNLFDYQDAGVTKWHPWKSLSQSYLYINADWTPQLYVGFVLLTALAICLLQICYNYVCGDSSGCKCKGRTMKSSCKDVAYTNIESNIPAMLPHQSAVYYSDKKRAKQSISKTKTSSLGSIRTQKVYDLNENTEKLMAVIMSDNESDAVSLDSKSNDGGMDDHVIDVGQSGGSAPKLETSISQLKIERTPRSGKKPRVAMYSTSTMSPTERTYCQEEGSESWSATGSSTSGRSVTSTSSKTQTRRSRSSRDLAWARRVISKHSTRDRRSTTGTDLDLNSFTTPPTQR